MDTKEKRNATKVAIIGAGVAGLAAAKYLLAKEIESIEPYFKVTIFKRNSEVAGIWNLTSLSEGNFQTPVYEGLQTNVPRTLMTYEGVPYPPDVSLFPTHDKTKEYLEQYSKDIRHLIKLDSVVKLVTKVTKNYQRKWEVEIANSATSTKSTASYFDAVVVATGRFNTFCVPPDLDWNAWEESYPGSVIHSGEFMDAQ